MPILKKEADVFPENIFALAGDAFPWWVLHVRSRQEKVIARELLRENVPFYLPQVEHRVRRNGRNFTSHIPLFPGYVFFRGEKRSYASVWRNDLITRILPADDVARLNDELLQVFELQRAGAAFVPYPALAAGDAVRITEGPFKGYRGVVVREKGGLRLVISVSMLQRSLSVELDRDVLAPERAAV